MSPPKYNDHTVLLSEVFINLQYTRYCTLEPTGFLLIHEHKASPYSHPWVRTPQFQGIHKKQVKVYFMTNQHMSTDKRPLVGWQSTDSRLTCRLVTKYTFAQEACKWLFINLQVYTVQLLCALIVGTALKWRAHTFCIKGDHYSAWSLW